MTTRAYPLTQRLPRSSRRAAFPRWDAVPAWSGIVAMAVGVVALLGWMIGADTLNAMIPGLPTMKPSTAVVFVVMGLGLVLHALSTRDPRSSRASSVAFAVVLGIALATAAEYLFRIDLGAELITIRGGSDAPGAILPGRMAPSTVIGFVAIASAALAASRAPRLTSALCGVALAVTLLNELNYAFGAAVPVFLGDYTQMAANTSVTMGAVAIGVLATLGPASPFAPLGDGHPSARLLRRLVVVALAVPTLITWLCLEGQWLGLYDTSFGASLVAVGVTVLSVLAILSAAHSARRTEASRQAAELERDRFFDLSIDLLAVFDAAGRFQRANRAWASTMGYPAAGLVGMSVFDMVHPDDLERTAAAIGSQFDGGDEVAGFEIRCRHQDGTDRWLEWMSRLAPDGSSAFAIARDITDRKRLEARRARLHNLLAIRNETLSESAARDPLTGLHNRRYFESAVARRERRWRREPVDGRPPVSVIMFDLDHFGEVNKRHGHQAGDTVLRRFADLLKDRLRVTDLVARYGGEEFVVILEGATASEACRVADEIRAAMEATSMDFNLGTPLQVTVSAGCAQVDEEADLAVALSRADVWLAQAKRAGRNQVIGL